MISQQVQEIVEYLTDLSQDNDMGKRFKEKAERVITILTSNIPLAVEKSLHELEELNSSDVPSYCRTQLWDVVSMLESIKQ
ncbi:hypothetical protein HOL21_01375 [Candidatus Woesearchaeota archaeon]|jgi:uncharacterized protein (UPF0147 family)|nr:hypothetical protein [Candidatus Woesearchaeota archaeon]MBT5396843.1 hypothetical protein [Candidatus Woesearchaeota archaeon]MBT5924538.1 hypothetical protein [Candidatus Woesearchaeota archaeon]MBT6367731.1 hypothetical protein [Candidatus Woesearchaeota archaeon]MBT7762868.1 hypothetical protein [Candidatus Woesearchaeota archaeon]